MYGLNTLKKYLNCHSHNIWLAIDVDFMCKTPERQTHTAALYLLYLYR